MLFSLPTWISRFWICSSGWKQHCSKPAATEGGARSHLFHCLSQRSAAPWGTGHPPKGAEGGREQRANRRQAGASWSCKSRSPSYTVWRRREVVWWMWTHKQLSAWDFWGRTETLSLSSGLKGQDWLCDIIAWDEEQTPWSGVSRSTRP